MDYGRNNEQTDLAELLAKKPEPIKVEPVKGQVVSQGGEVIKLGQKETEKR